MATAQSTYYVSPTGADDPLRDGLSTTTAFASLAYACDRATAGSTIQLAAGTYVATVAAEPKPGTTIQGAGMQQTIIQSDPARTMQQRPKNEFYLDYLIAFHRFPQGYNNAAGHGMTIRDLRLESDVSNLAHGGIFMRDINNVLIENVHAEDFGWAGFMLQFGANITVRNCFLQNANRVEDDFFSGNIHTAWLSDSDFHDNTFRNTVPGSRQWGVGYKGGGHTNCRIFNNDFTTGSGFDIEIPFEQEWGLEIFNNQFNRTISIPKPGANGDPSTRGFTYSIWIHDNYFNFGYDIEGPRGYLRVSHNFFDTPNDNHRTIAQFGGNVSEPMWVHHNVATGVDRSFIWKGGGTRDNVSVYNNTVYYDVAGANKAATIDLAGGTANVGWDVRNNLFVMPATEPRAAGTFAAGAQNTYTHNLLVNAEGPVPPGNFVDTTPGLTLSGAQPDPYFRPADAQSFVVDAGVDVGLPYQGAAPDIGAYELATALPVALTSLRATATPGGFALSWTVAAAENFSHFEVEELNPTGKARVLGEAAADARRFSGLWTETDPELRLFRLRLVDLDGAVDYSNVVTVTRNTTAQAWQVSPNPVRETFRVPDGFSGEYVVYGTDGRTVRQGHIAPGGKPTVDVRYLLPGSYYVVLLGTDRSRYESWFLR